MRPPAYQALVEKSRAACVAAVETYNRALAPYREENFAILMINAWELLLKARVVKENNGKLRSIYWMTYKLKSDKTPGKKKIVKLTSAGLPYTIGIGKACDICSGYSIDKVDRACVQNIEALLVIRDSATHFVVKTALLNHTLVEISLAAVRNYVIAAQKWFKVSFDDLNIASIPLSFALDKKNIEAAAKKQPKAVLQFLAYVQELQNTVGSGPSDFTFAVKVDFDLTKKKVDGALKAVIVGPDDSPDIKVVNVIKQIPDGFEWDYSTLTAKLAARYTDFKQNAKYHKLRKPLEKDAKMCYEHYLNVKDKKGRKRYYSTNIVTRIDPHYTRVSK